MMYVAVRVRHEDEPVGIVRLALPLDEIDAQIVRIASVRC